MKLLSLAYWGLVCVTAPFFFLGALVIFAVTVAFDRRRVVLHLYSCAWGTFFVALNPLWRLHVSGRERLPWRGPAVIVANHASLVDILVLFGLFRPYKWVSKAENFKLPFIGWNMTLNGYVPLVRGDRTSVAIMLDRCRALLAQGSPVLFFPEGTRTKDGRLLPFKDGAFELAQEIGCPLIPIAVHGTGRALPKHGIVLRDHVDARLEILEPLDPREFADVGALRDAAREHIGAALGQLDRSGAPDGTPTPDAPDADGTPPPDGTRAPGRAAVHDTAAASVMADRA